MPALCLSIGINWIRFSHNTDYNILIGTHIILQPYYYNVMNYNEVLKNMLQIVFSHMMLVPGTYGKLPPLSLVIL